MHLFSRSKSLRPHKTGDVSEACYTLPLHFNTRRETTWEQSCARSAYFCTQKCARARYSLYHFTSKREINYEHAMSWSAKTKKAIKAASKLCMHVICYISITLRTCLGSGSGCWGTLWGPLTSYHTQNGPQLPSSAQEGLPVPVFSPGWLLIPPILSHVFFWWGGLVELRCRGRAEWTEAKATKTTCHGLLLSVSSWRPPEDSFLQSAHPPFMLCQSCVVCAMCFPPYCVLIWFVSCPRLGDYELILFQMCFCDYL